MLAGRVTAAGHTITKSAWSASRLHSKRPPARRDRQLATPRDRAVRATWTRPCRSCEFAMIRAASKLPRPIKHAYRWPHHHLQQSPRRRGHEDSARLAAPRLPAKARSSSKQDAGARLAMEKAAPWPLAQCAQRPVMCAPCGQTDDLPYPVQETAGSLGNSPALGDGRR